MSKIVVLGVIPDPSSAEAAVGSLGEAGVSMRNLSALSADSQTTRALGAERGPLAGVTEANLESELGSLGVSPGDATRLVSSFKTGAVLVAVVADSQYAGDAQQTMKDYGASDVVAVAQGGEKQ